MNNVTVTASSNAASGEVHGIENYYSSSILMTNVTVNATGPALCYAVKNLTVLSNVNENSTFRIMNSTFTASGTGTNYGISNDVCPFIFNNITVIAQNGSSNYGMWNGSGDIQVDRSTFEGASSSIHNSDTMRIGSSKLVGTVASSAGTIACVGSYNGNYTALDATCQ
jgi:hypothetical protein